MTKRQSLHQSGRRESNFRRNTLSDHRSRHELGPVGAGTSRDAERVDNVSDFQLPERFRKWAYDERAEMVRRMASGEKIQPEIMFLSFTRHNPAFISNGPGGLNGSIKGVGFVPKKEYLDETLQAYMRHIDKGWRESYSEEGLNLLVKYMWSPEAKARIDFSIMGSLEMAFKHSWANFQASKDVTLLFFQPAMVSYEVRGEIEIVREGPCQQYLNAQHDVYHKPNKERWASRPAYIIHIKEVFDNSASKDGFGTKIL